MAETRVSIIHGVIVEEAMQFTLVDLCRACGVEREQLIALVDEGVLEPSGNAPQDWLFSGPSLRRARAALRVGRDLELNPAGVALVLDLLDEIDALRARLRRLGGR